MKFLNKIDGAKRLVQDSENRLVTDIEKTLWNNPETGAPNLTLTELTLGNFKLRFNETKNSLDIIIEGGNPV